MAPTVAPRRAAVRGAPHRLGLARVVMVILVSTAAVARATDPPQNQPPSQPQGQPQGQQQGQQDRPPGLERIPGPLPTTAPDMLMLADALVRGGHLPEAVILLELVTQRFPGTGWAQWGELGLGALEVANGHFDEARPHLQAAATGFSRDTALIVLALIDGDAGASAQALATLQSVAADPAARPAARDAAALGAAYVRYWAGDWSGAAVAFGSFAETHPDGPLADDALYGLAQAFLHLGDREAADEALQRIDELPVEGFDDQHVRPALRHLALRELVRATRERYQAVPLGQPDQMLTALLDVNGRVLAHGTRRILEKADARKAHGATLGGDHAAGAAAGAGRRGGMVGVDQPMGAPGSGAGHDADVRRAKRAGGTAADADPAADGAASPDGTARADGAAQPHGGAGVAIAALAVLVLVLVVRQRRRAASARDRHAAGEPAAR
jgi:tetratricopeptide (TPR) repeat protein